jgi:hypothetical protein
MKRRTWLQLGVGSAVLLGAAGAGVALTTPPGFTQGHLSAAAREACAAVARAVLAGRWPVEADEARRVADAYLERLEATIAGFTRAVQGEVSELLTILSTAPGRVTMMGVMRPWASASVADVQAGLASMRRSSLSLKVQAYHALRDLTHAAYYADESRWGDLGYPGPAAV